MAAVALVAAMLAGSAAAQDSGGIEPMTGLPWRVIYAVGADGAGRRIEFYIDRVSVAEMKAAAEAYCRRNGESGRASVWFEQQNDAYFRDQRTRYMFVRCK